MILLTGSSGFIGSFISQYFERYNIQYKSICRSKSPNSNNFQIDLNEHSHLYDILDGVDTVIHAAAKAHVMNEFHSDHMNEYKKINTLATLNLAKQSIKSNVKKFIFLSTIKVNGECTKVNEPLSEISAPNPIGPYAISKFEAEEGLKDIFKNSKTELIILRIPLVYGPGVKGNLRLLTKAINLYMPLPFKLIQNKRSFLSAYNLVDVLNTIINHPGNLKQLYLLSDNNAMSLPELISLLGLALEKKTFLFPFPLILLRFIFKIIGKNDQFTKLTGNLEIDNSLIKNDLGLKQAYDIKNSFLDFSNASNL
jgi:nucleoside-diphosphate-sugar epimerase